MPEFFCSDLPNDQDLIRELGTDAIPVTGWWTDVCFCGDGGGGAGVLVAVERKKVGDMASCVYDGRFLSQMQVCRETGCTIMCLVLEGVYRPGEDGLLEVPVWGTNPRTGKRAELWCPVRPFIQFSRFDQYLTEIDYLAGVVVKHSRNVSETAAIIRALWGLFVRPYDSHQSLHQMFSPPPPTVELCRPGLLRRVAKELPCVGWERSKAVAARFGSVLHMAVAPREEWLQIDGIGGKIADKVISAISGGDIGE